MTHTIICKNHGTEDRRHGSAATVRACFDGAEIGTCGWLVRRTRSWVDDETGYGESWDVEEDCGAECVFDERGYRCAAGHEHVNMQTRATEGWDYAEEYGEAQALAFAGVEPRTMDGHLVISPADFMVGA